MNLQDIILKFDRYWARQGCAIIQPYDLEKGAGTYNPATFFGSLTALPVSTAYVEPCRRPADGRYGENPNRLGRYYQYQVIIKPPRADIQQVYLNSLKAVGIDHSEHDIRWIEDDWESPTLGASGVGWEVWLDGMEITQFTYFQHMASFELNPITVEITYGLERLAMFAQKKDSIFDIKWNNHVTYGELHKEQEEQFSHYNFEAADVENLRSNFERWEKEVFRLVKMSCYLPAYDLVMKCSHNFNLLDARGAISVSERVDLIKRIRVISRACAAAYVKDNESAPGIK
ncbi:MAG: glycine--tRNA ligase subunit alpha [Elusimicrobia bacterium GWF2_52_66]|nr:MAG: glycine--tRNA ligase subunit alpha [Elusimicrobia bacterium GWA2_51_34]OGR85772.1 MAG: glycine--tRNA ligase subunit alpha [Elusimicrobia bacterium GWF2_52_66]HAF95651.1 glycine--tRNA ligase subunit alpha [Elusimicrobiota bacterium]HCE97441.1 glycine--tRNA ligase subunit alpha [Elusimicrobiota bacterium]